MDSRACKTSVKAQCVYYPPLPSSKDVDGYQNRDKPTIEAWAKYIEENRGDRSVEYLVITCVKKEKKSVKTVLERLRSRFGNK